MRRFARPLFPVLLARLEAAAEDWSIDDPWQECHAMCDFGETARPALDVLVKLTRRDDNQSALIALGRLLTGRLSR